MTLGSILVAEHKPIVVVKAASYGPRFTPPPLRSIGAGCVVIAVDLVNALAWSAQKAGS